MSSSKYRRAWWRIVGTTLGGMAIVGAFACASGQLEPRTAHDPANPNALEAPSVPSPSTASTLAAHEPLDHAGADAGAISYVCPMHPDVVRAEPGTCPKCGMRLVPKSSP